MQLCHISCVLNLSTLSAFYFDFRMCFVVLEQKFLPIRSGKISVFRAKFAYFRALSLGVCVPPSSTNRAVFEPKTCVSSSTGAVFEPRSCQFRAQEDILSSRNCADFEPEPYIFRALFVLLSSPFVLCPFEHWLFNMLRGKAWRFFAADQFQ